MASKLARWTVLKWLIGQLQKQLGLDMLDGFEFVWMNTNVVITGQLCRRLKNWLGGCKMLVAWFETGQPMH